MLAANVRFDTGVPLKDPDSGGYSGARRNVLITRVPIHDGVCSRDDSVRASVISLEAVSTTSVAGDGATSAGKNSDARTIGIRSFLIPEAGVALDSATGTSENADPIVRTSARVVVTSVVDDRAAGKRTDAPGDARGLVEVTRVIEDRTTYAGLDSAAAPRAVRNIAIANAVADRAGGADGNTRPVSDLIVSLGRTALDEGVGSA